MNDLSFLENFIFNEYNQKKLVHNDLSMGSTNHFIGFMKCGHARIVTDSKELKIKEGDLFYIPRGLKYHSFWSTDDTVAVYDSIGFRYFPSTDSSQFALQIIERTPEIDKAYSHFINNKEINLYSIGCLYNLLSKLENVLKREKKTKSEIISDNFIRLVNKNPLLSISEYAAMLKISEALLYRYVKTALNKTPNQLRVDAVCDRACVLLASTDYSIEEISEKCGFSSSAYFRKVIFSTKGKNPSQIRKASRQM